jgi:hypothetical protein
MKQLFTTQAVDGNSQQWDWPGGNGMIAAQGTWGSGTIQLQVTPDAGTTWINVSGISITADGTVTFACAPGQVRLNLSGSGGASLNAWISGMDLD